MKPAHPAPEVTSAPVRRRDLHATGARPSGAPRSAPRHAGSAARHRIRTSALALVGVFAFTLTAGGIVYAQLQSEVDSIDVGDLVNGPPAAAGEEATEPPADPNAGTALDILIIGSDSREDGAVGDGFTSVLADTHIIAHVSADRSRVELVSIPRDVMVDIPECLTSGGETLAAGFGMYNSAFAAAYAAGGDKKSAIACDINLAQSVTGLSIDGWVLVEMGGFVDMVNALDGVDICIPEAIDAPKADLHLDAGQQTLTGKEALGYARARSGDGLSGSDPDRIKRQQHLMSAMVDEVLSRNILTDGPALYQTLSAALGSLTVSENLSSLTDMSGLALSMRALGSDDVTFLTTPFAAYEPDPNRLVFIDSEVDAIWLAMANDEPIPTAESEEEKPEVDNGSGDGEQSGDITETEEPPADEPTTPVTETEEPPADEPTTPAEGGTAGANAQDLNPVCTG